MRNPEIDEVIEVNPHRIPKPRVIRYNETEYFDDEIQEKVIAIYMDYVYDDGECTYCMEMTPSFWLMHYNIDVHFKDEISEEEREALWETIYEEVCMNDNNHYAHCKGIEPYSVDAINFVQWDDDTMEDVIDRLRSNPPYFNN